LNELYGDNYGYRSGLNPAMVAHLEKKVVKILDLVSPPGGSLIIDIGSNDGTTLKAYPAGRFDLVGIDPTGAKFHRFYPSHVQLLPEFFSRDVVRKHFGPRKASVVTSFSMFYDLEHPMSFVQEVRDVLDDAGVWVFEQSYMPTMLRMNAYDTVCHEHLEYYALHQIQWMAQRCGLKVIDVEFNDVNGGSFSVIAAKEGSDYRQSGAVKDTLDMERDLHLDTLEPYRDFSERVAETRLALRRFLDDARRDGKRVAALGASTKGNVLLQYCGIGEADIARIGEVNEEKIGSFTPGSLLPIASEDEVLAGNPDYLVMLPWHFRSFFMANPKYSDRSLLFPLPQPEVVHCSRTDLPHQSRSP
jgi:NDP-4-keto-2,6-dideoxyhexose 3-C-methyltransferase